MKPTYHTNQYPLRGAFRKAPILAFFLALLLIPIGAIAKERVPLKIGATFTSCPECDEIVDAFADIPTPEENDQGAPYLFTNWGYDEGTATHFGAFTTIYQVDFFADGSAISHFIVTAADGSWIAGMNWITPTGEDTSEFVAEFGGDYGEASGRFEGITARVEGGIVFNGDGTADYEAEGTIDNLGRAKKKCHQKRTHSD